MLDYIRALKNSTFNARAFVIFTFLMSLYIGIYNVIFNLYVIKLGYTEQFLGLIISASMISTGLFAFPAAQCCDRMGSKMCLVTSGLLTSVTLYLLYTVTSADLLLVLSILNGILGAIPTVIGHPFLVENSSRENRLHVFSISFGTIMAATIIGTSAGGYLPQLCQAFFGLQEIGVDAYRYTLMISLAIAALSVVPLIFIKDRKKPCSVKGDMKTFVRRLAESRVVRQLVLISCLIGMGAGLIVPFFNVYFNKVLYATTGEIGIIFSLAQISMVASAVIVPYLARRIGKVRMIALSYLCSIPFLVMLALTSNLYLAGAAYVLRMLFMNMSSPISNSFSMEIVDAEDMASVSSLTSTGNYIAISIGSLIAGVLMSWGAYTMPYYSACIFYGLAAVLYFKFFRRYEEKAETPLREVEVSM
ncbi:MFS transporter [Methanocella arvoryzae]|nr:MFS transporter [Methanocella arvoryzae]